MRFAALLLAISPSFAFGETIVARIAPTSVTVFSGIAEVRREANFELPAGRHEVLFPDLPQGYGADNFDIKIPNATILASAWKPKVLSPVPDPETPEFKQAQSALLSATTALNALKDKIEEAKLEGEAANAQIAFLAKLADSDALPEGIENLRDLSKMIAEETLQARKLEHQAAIKTRTLNLDLSDLQKGVIQAQANLDALLPASEVFAQLTVSVEVPKAASSSISLRYIVEGPDWSPTYDWRLTTGQTPRLKVERGAKIFNKSGENWDNVEMTLSTVTPTGKTQPWGISPQLLRITEPQLNRNQALRLESSISSMADAVSEAPVIVEEASSAFADLSGFDVTYSFNHTINIKDSSDNNDTSGTKVTLGTLDFNAQMSALAIPHNDETAYRIVSFTNTSSERLMPSDASTIFVDGNIIALTHTPDIVPNAEIDLGFGPIHGLRLKRVVLDRNEGDRGIINRSNEKTENVRIDVENLTDEAWEISILDRVPFTEQENLEIDWSSSPNPSTIDYKDQRGILKWDFEVNKGETNTITLNTKITWPEGMILR